jgi:RNA polymerase sigma factor (sigma-70 family)
MSNFMHDATDAQLLTDFNAGNHDAFRVLADRYISLIYATAKRHAPPHLAEDITQAVFILLAQRSHSLRNAALLPAWLLKVTYFCAADARRADQRRRRHERKAATMAPSITSPDASLDHQDLEFLLDAALRTLSESDRTAILLRFYREQPLSQVALSLDTTEQAVQKRITRALEKLQKVLLHNKSVLAAPALAALLAKQAAAAPPTLASRVCTAALAKSTSATTAALIAKGATKLMAYTTAKYAAAATLAVLLTAGTAELLHSRHPAPSPTVAIAEPAPAPAPAPPPPALIDPNPTIDVRDMATGKPLEGVQIEISPGYRQGPSLFATTAADGTVTTHLPPNTVDDLTLTARKEGFVSATIGDSRTFPEENLAAKYSFQLEKATTIGGRVVDDAGTPLANALVDVTIYKQYKGLPQNIPWGIRTTTNAQGEWSLAAAPEQCQKIEVGAFHKSCISAGYIYSGEAVSLSALQARTAITTLKRGTPVHVIIHGPDGKPRKGWIGLGDQRIASNTVPELPTADDGQCDLSADPRAPLYLVARADGCAAQIAKYTAGAAQPLIITLQPATPLHVRVIDMEGHPMPNAVLSTDYYHTHEYRYARGIDNVLTADHDGQISWPDAFNEHLFVNLSAPGCLTQSDIPVDPGQTNEITMLRRFVIHATVVDAETGQPAANFRVVEGNFDSVNHKTINYSDYPEWEAGHIRRTGPGTFDFTDSQQHDTFVLRILGGDYQPTDSPLITTDGHDQSLTVEVRKGKRLAGTLLDTHGNPLEKTYIYIDTTNFDVYDADLPTKPTVEPGYDNSAFFALTDDAGHFSFPPQKGNFVLVASNSNGYAIIKAKAFKKKPILQLTPWAKIDGTLLTNGKPAANTPVEADLTAAAFQDEIGPFCHFNTTTDANGLFSFPKTFVGPFNISGTTITTLPGETATVTVETPKPQ